MEADNYLKKELYQLIKSDERIFDFVQDSALDGLWYWDMENPENEWMNSKFWSVLGYDPKEMPHKSNAWQGIINQDDLKVASENFTKHCENPDHPYDQIVRYTHKNGSIVWIRCRGMAIRDDSGKPVRMLGAHHEVTDLKNAEFELRKAKEKAEESEKIFRSYFNSNPSATFVWTFDNNDLILSDFNETANKIAHYNAKKFIGLKASEIYSDFPYINDKIHECFNTKSTIEFEYEYLSRQSGINEWINSKLVFFEPDKVLFFTELITNKKRTEIELINAKEKAEESEKRISSIIENTQAGYFYIDNQGIFQNVNKAWLAIYEFLNFDEVLGKHFSTILQINQIEKVNQAFEEIRNGNPVFMNGTFSRLHNDNTIGYHTISAHPVFINNSVEGFEGFIVDITAQKEIELSLQRSQALLSDAEISTGMGCWEWDIDNDIAYWSNGLFNIFKRNPAEGTPNWKQHSEFYVKEDFEEYKKVVAECLNSGLPYQFEMRAICADGEIKHCIARGHVERNPENRINRMWGTLQDITKQKYVEKELIVAKEKAEESDRLKSAFLANMSHEIRTPLNSIIGFSELLGDADFPEDQKSEFIQHIISNGNNLLNVISDIVDISKIESGEIAIRNSKIQVVQFLDEIRSLHRINVEGKKLRLNLTCDESVIETDCAVFADKERVQQIFNNLISNALKFTSEGYIEMGCRQVGDSIEFHIKDTGIGIPAQYHQKVFDRFRQVEASYTRKYGGTGLGLAISKKLIELMGGEIWVESELGKGSTFYFTIPKS